MAGQGCEEWQAGAEELAEHLDVLEVPYTMTIARGPSKRTERQLGWRIEIARKDLYQLEKFVPSLRRLIDAVEGNNG